MNQPSLTDDPEVNYLALPKGSMVGPLFTICVRPLPHVDPTRALRRTLKALQRAGLRCTAVNEYNKRHHVDVDRFPDRHSHNGGREGAHRKRSLLLERTFRPRR